MTFKQWILPLFTGGALSAVYFLPQAGETAQSAVKMELPGINGGWEFRSIPPSKEELATLQKDTEFAKAVCLKPRPGEITLDGQLIPDRVDVSVVLSGHDLNNSIHRPERCMPAQGHSITASSDMKIDLPNGRNFKAKRLKSVQSIKGSKNDTDPAQFNCVTYYFFIGHDRITNDHLERTLVDMKDRLVHGMDQRWAYVSASMWFGKIPWIEKQVSEEEADAKLREFVGKFAEEQISWQQIKK